MLFCDQNKIITWIDKALESLHLNRISIFVGSEIEFYLRASTSLPSDEQISLFSCYINNLDICHPITVEKEKGRGQYEIPIQYTNPKQALELIDIVREEVKASARKAGIDAIFTPKPFPDDYGSALHLHISMHGTEGDNLFANNDGFMESVIYSILDLICTDLDFICDEEDMNRFKEGWMAPSHVCWGGNNRTVAIRVPQSKPENKRFEFRLPSANSDQYKVLLFILVGMLKSKEILGEYPKIYGNAHDEQYSLQPLKFSNNIEKKNFIDVAQIDALLGKLCESVRFNL